MDLTQFSVSSLFGMYTTSTALATLVQQFYHQFVPKVVRTYIASKIQEWLERKPADGSDIFTLVIHERNSTSYNSSNILYQACRLYLTEKLRPEATRLMGTRTSTDKHVEYHLARGENYTETLEKEGIEVKWKYSSKNEKGENDESGNIKSFELTFDLAYKKEVLEGYIPFVVLKYYDQIMETEKQIYLYTSETGKHWNSVKFKHPFTFDSLALDSELKRLIIDDLDMFIRRKEFYNRVGKAWKRGYLLYGPPGTGKSSLVAAIANYLKFSIYDLQLGGIQDDATLRKLMLSTQNRSILVIEDIDCTIGLSRAPPSTNNYSSSDSEEDSMSDDRVGKSNHDEKVEVKSKGNSKISLSGLLNLIDGLWSSCGHERNIIFTTNHKERLDPAMLRPGRMDMHIHMSYLTMTGFRVLANNYLCVSEEHPLFEEIESLLKNTEVTPAQVAEELIRSEDPDVALSKVVEFLKAKSKQCQKKQKRDKKTTQKISVNGKKMKKNGKKMTSKTSVEES